MFKLQLQIYKYVDNYAHKKINKNFSHNLWFLEKRCTFVLGKRAADTSALQN